VVIMNDALPQLKRFLNPLGLRQQLTALLIRCIVAFTMHRGRMAATRAASAARSQPRHRAPITRLLGRKWLRKLLTGRRMACSALGSGQARGHLPVLGRSDVGQPARGQDREHLQHQQGDKTENTFSTGNRQRRPRKGRRYNQHKHTRKSCHAFVQGLLITPSGFRVPFSKSYYTRDYCAAKGKPHHAQAELAAQMIAELPLPEGSPVVVLGDTAYDAACIRTEGTTPQNTNAGQRPEGRSVGNGEALRRSGAVRRTAASQSLPRGAESETTCLLCAPTETSCAFGRRGAVGLLDEEETL
jgi:hypothetical protein